MYVWVYVCTKLHFGEVPPRVYDIGSRLLQYIYRTNVKVKVPLIGNEDPRRGVEVLFYSFFNQR
jgi:hypothetical protein